MRKPILHNSNSFNVYTLKHLAGDKLINIKQITITTIIFILTSFTLGVAAESDNKGNADKTSHEHKKNNSDKHQGADSKKQSWGDNERHEDDDRHSNTHDNKNSNRQSEPDSTRGQERAEERRSDNASKHGQSNIESHWYDFIYGKDDVRDNVKIDDLAEKKPRWWWPFN